MPNSNKFRPIRETVRQARDGAGIRNLQVPLEDSNFGMLLIFREYEYQRPGGSRENPGRFANLETSNARDTIFLPLPENLTDGIDLRVSRFDQGLLGSIASEVISGATSNGLSLGALQEGAIRALQRSLPAAFSSGENFANTIADSLKAIAGLGDGNSENLNRFSGDIAFLLRRTISGNAERIIDAGSGTMVNPKAALSFEGVEMKAHNFSWTIAPKSPEESVNLRDVIQTIKKNILPQYVTGEVTQRALFRYPAMMDIFFVGLDGNFYYFFKTAMVRSFNANYTPNNVAVLKGGRPAAVQMQMSVMEMDIHTSEDHGGESFALESGSASSRDVGR